MADVTKATILVVDDYSMNLKMAEFALKSKYNVIPALSGERAIQILSEKSDIDLVLLDVLMPEMDGFDTYARIRQIETHKDTPVCFLTGDEDENTLSRIKELGLSVINKPFDPALLHNVIASLLD